MVSPGRLILRLDRADHQTRAVERPSATSRGPVQAVPQLRGRVLISPVTGKPGPRALCCATFVTWRVSWRPS